jgi:hypothetical protein
MIAFPLLLIPLAIYNIIAFLMPTVKFEDPLFKLVLLSGAEWRVTLSDILLAVGILLLLLEVVKGARPGAKYLTDHLLSLIVFGGAVAEFLLWPRFANSTYFLLALLTLVDFISGVALHVRRGSQLASAPAVSRRESRRATTAAAEPSFDPAPSAPVPASPLPSAPVSEARSTPAPAATPSPASADVAEAMPSDHPEPVVRAETAPVEPPPETAPSPSLQPGNSSERPLDAPPH